MSYVTRQVRHQFLDTCARLHSGRLHLTLPDGERQSFGTGGTEIDMAIHDWSVIPALAARGDIGLGETYVAGLWDTSSVETLSTVAMANFDVLQGYGYPSLWNKLKFRAIDRLLRANSRRGAARNIRAHYDVGNEFYQLWLDRSMTYSSALYAPGDDDLERAQRRKYERVLDRLASGERVLEIGCGWGGFAERAADQGRHVTGITISPSQLGYADARLDGRADIRLQDYRATGGTYDNIVSIEMVEAVGERYWPGYFQTLKSRLAEGGRAVLQAITVQDHEFDTYRRASDYIRQYTFPGGMLLSDAMIAHQARQAGLRVTNNFAFGQDYARTCRAWSRRLEAQAKRVLAQGRDQAFLRNWHYYLEISASAFAVGQTDVVQVELAHA